MKVNEFELIRMNDGGEVKVWADGQIDILRDSHMTVGFREARRRALRPEGREQVRHMGDHDHYEWLCERLVEHSLHIQRVKPSSIVSPRGGFAIFTNSTMLGFGETIDDAIKHAIKQSSPQAGSGK